LFGSSFNGTVVDDMPTINGNVFITADNFTLQDCHITGNLTINAANTVFLINVTVDGATIFQ
jgi:hypothetical protein